MKPNKLQSLNLRLYLFHILNCCSFCSLFCYHCILERERNLHELIEVQSIKFVINKNGEQDGITFKNKQMQNNRALDFLFIKMPFLHFKDLFMVKIKELENF